MEIKTILTFLAFWCNVVCLDDWARELRQDIENLREWPLE